MGVLFYELPSPKLIMAAVVRHIARHTNPGKLGVYLNDEREAERDKDVYNKVKSR